MDLAKAYEVVSQLFAKDGSLLTKRKIRDLIFKDKDNRIVDVDTRLAQSIFGENTPFRFLKSEKSIEESERNIQTLCRVYDICSYLNDHPRLGGAEILEQVSTFTREDIFKRRDEWKQLGKTYRDIDLPLGQQLALSVVRSLYVDPTCIEREFLDEYMEKYGNDQPCIKYQLDEIDYGISQYFVDYYNERLKDIEPLDKTPIPAANKASSMSRRKAYDWYYLYKMLDEYEVINSKSKRALLLCLRMIQDFYSFDVSELIRVVESKDEDENTTNLIQFLPKGGCVAQRKNKVGRFVCAGNDIYDLALQPLMKTTQIMESVLPCFSPNHLNDKVSNADLAKKTIDNWARGFNFRLNSKESCYLSSSCTGADSSDATEKFNGYYMFNSWRVDYDNLNPDIRDKFGLSDNYIDMAEELLTETPFWIYNNGNYYVMYTNGTSQGLKVSWDDLNYGNMKVLARSFALYIQSERYIEPEDSYKFAFKATLRSQTDGDDGLFPSFVKPFYVKELSDRALPGIINTSKTGGEDEKGYVEYISAYVQTGYVAPKILSNVMMISLVTDMSDPFKVHDYLCKPFMRQQLQLLQPILESFKTDYNVANLPFTLGDSEKLEVLRKFAKASSIIRYKHLRDVVAYIDTSKYAPINEMVTYGPVRELAPSIRAKMLVIHNMNIDYSKAYTIASQKALTNCYLNVGNLFKELDLELSQIGELLFDNPMDEICTDLSPDDEDIVRRILIGIPLQSKIERTIFINREILEENFECSYTGFCSKDFVISCNMRTIKEESRYD